MKRARTKSERGRVQSRLPLGRRNAEGVERNLPAGKAFHLRPSNISLYLMLRLVRPVEAAGRHFGSSLRYGCRSLYSNGSARSHDPLTILFCGADEFSIYSLRALRELQSKKPDKIAGIDVVCRPDKYVGRGLRRIQEGPFGSLR